MSEIGWAVAYVYDDGEIRYRHVDDEEEARAEASEVQLRNIVDGPSTSGALPVTAYPAYRELGPWQHLVIPGGAR